MNNTVEHQKLVDDILLTIGSMPNVRLWPRRVGLAIPIGRRNPVYYGIKGEPDLQGIIRVPRRRYNHLWHLEFLGLCLAIEVKTGAGKLSADQILWRDMFVKFGGIYIEAHCLEDACQSVKSVLE